MKITVKELKQLIKEAIVEYVSPAQRARRERNLARAEEEESITPEEAQDYFAKKRERRDPANERPASINKLAGIEPKI